MNKQINKPHKHCTGFFSCLGSPTAYVESGALVSLLKCRPIVTKEDICGINLRWHNSREVPFISLAGLQSRHRHHKSPPAFGCPCTTQAVQWFGWSKKAREKMQKCIILLLQKLRELCCFTWSCYSNKHSEMLLLHMIFALVLMSCALWAANTREYSTYTNYTLALPRLKTVVSLRWWRKEKET